jgi:hypothetical protein
MATARFSKRCASLGAMIQARIAAIRLEKLKSAISAAANSK